MPAPTPSLVCLPAMTPPAWRQPARPGRQRRPPRAAARGRQPTDLQVDVCILGAGIIGLSTALMLLRQGVSVALVEKEAAICSGSATGAGQGYLWLAHRDPASPLWQVAVESRRLWQELLQGSAVPDVTPASVEWQATGSMLLASSREESEALQQRADWLRSAGVPAEVLPAQAVRQREPALHLGPDGSALLVPSDSQISGRATAAAVLQACQAFGDHFVPLFAEAVSRIVASPSGNVDGVETTHRSIFAELGVVVALGAWTGDFLAEQLQEQRWAAAVKPRRGLLLEMQQPAGMPPISAGLMEVGYTKHYSQVPAAEGMDITFTATTSAAGSLLVGSSREFAGFDSTTREAAVDAILQRGAEFLPGLAAVQRQGIAVRCGPRPYAQGGRPLLGPVPGAPGLFVAAGHEGSGLMLAPVTAQLMADHVLQKSASPLAEHLKVTL